MKKRLIEKEKMRGIIRTIDAALNGYATEREFSFVLTVFKRDEEKLSQIDIVSNNVDLEDILEVFYEVTDQVDAEPA